MSGQINRERILKTFLALSAIDSPSYGERKMCSELKKRLEALGLSVREDDSAERSGSDCGNLIARLNGTLDLPYVLYCSHMDTVEPSRGKHAVIHRDGRITSDGKTVLGADDCCGLAAILESLQVIQEEKILHGPLEIIFTTAEEAYDQGAQQLDFSGIRAKEGYVFDLTGRTGRAARRAPSIISLRITVFGKASHAGFAPEKGIHAVQIAAKAVASLRMGHVDDETTANVGTITGGAAANIVPESCTVTGEVRSFSHQKALRETERIIRIFREAAEAEGGRIEAESRICIKAYQTEENSRVVQRFLHACERLCVEPLLDETFGGSDMNVFADHGIEGLVVASAMEQCHSCGEYTTVEELCRVGQMALTLMTVPEDMKINRGRSR